MNRETRLVTEWTRAQVAADERFVSWVLLLYARPPESSRRSMMSDYLQTRGLDPARQVAVGEQQVFAALTDRSVLLGLYGGLFRFKPASLVATTGAAGLRLEWWDQPQTWVHERHMLMIYDDGTWSRHSAMLHPRSNVEAFVAALGPRAVKVEP